jgi:iron complex transport system ATP-binding protein
MLAVRDAAFAVAGRSLIAGVSLTVEAGELVVIAGPNGAGKSTLVKLVARESEPLSGTIEFNGRGLAEWPALDRARMLAMMPQASSLQFAFTGLEVALFGRYPHSRGLPRAGDARIAREALALMDAAHLAGRDFTTLSGGEKARVQMARVLAQLWQPCAIAGRRMPRLLLLDEPTAALDLKHQHAALAAARAFIRREGDVGVLAVLHDLNLAAQYADRVILMRDGRVAATGTPPETLTAQRVAETFDFAVRVLSHPDTGAPLLAAAVTADNNGTR